MEDRFLAVSRIYNHVRIYKLITLCGRGAPIRQLIFSPLTIKPATLTIRCPFIP